LAIRKVIIIFLLGLVVCTMDDWKWENVDTVNFELPTSTGSGYSETTIYFGPQEMGRWDKVSGMQLSYIAENIDATDSKIRIGLRITEEGLDGVVTEILLQPYANVEGVITSEPASLMVTASTFSSSVLWVEDLSLPNKVKLDITVRSEYWIAGCSIVTVRPL